MNKLRILIILITLLLAACKSKSEKSEIIQKETINTISSENKKFEEGDKLISNIEFIKTINGTCKRTNGIIQDNKEQRTEFNNRCEFYKITYNYDAFRSLENQRKIFKKENIDYYFNLTTKDSDSDDFKFVNLYSSKNGSKIDSLEVYYYENFIDALVEKGKYFYIIDKKIFTYGFYEDEDGIHNENLKEYKIIKGHFELVKSYSLD